MPQSIATNQHTAEVHAKRPLAAAAFANDPPTHVEGTAWDLRVHFCDHLQHGGPLLSVIGGLLIGTAIGLCIVALCTLIALIVNAIVERFRSNEAISQVQRLQVELNRVLTFIAIKQKLIQVDPNMEAGDRHMLVVDPVHHQARLTVYLQMCAYYGMVPKKNRVLVGDEADYKRWMPKLSPHM